VPENRFPRRQFLNSAMTALATTALWQHSRRGHAAEPADAKPTAARKAGEEIQFGLVTYLWAKDLSLPQLLATCEASRVLGVELRTTHRHGVEPTLTPAERREVQARFNDSPVTLVGLGSNERFDSPAPEQLRAALQATREFIRLSHDVGGTGVKVKGDQFYDSVPHDKTLAQVVAALQQLGDYGAGYGQQIRLEIHGGFADIATHFEIMRSVNHPNVRSCWNSNRQDLEGDGLAANFKKVRPYFGDTLHVRPLDSADYPFPKLMRLLVESDYAGWVLLEASGEVAVDQLTEKLAGQRELFHQQVALAQDPR
jgi:sugar phosphate isomerase/epimerase